MARLLLLPGDGARLQLLPGDGTVAAASSTVPVDGSGDGS